MLMCGGMGVVERYEMSENPTSRSLLRTKGGVGGWGQGGGAAKETRDRPWVNAMKSWEMENDWTIHKRLKIDLFLDT